MNIARHIRHLLTAIAVLSIAFCSAAYTQANKPRLPPGRDPGGIAVAFIGGGIDYTSPEIANRLARDGEGELVGWDFLDADRRPFNRCTPAQQASTVCPSDIARTILREAETGALVVARVSAASPQSVAQALTMVAQTRAQIVLLALTDGSAPLEPAFVMEAARRFPGMLLIVPVHGPGFAATAANALTIASAEAEIRTRAANLAVPTRMNVPSTLKSISPDQRAAFAGARIAALAARLAAAHPKSDAAELKRRILQLAAPTSARSRPGAAVPMIEKPDQPFGPR